ncbi:MAG: tetratricopeptide repeat protein [Candidatus Hydrothermarchaeales archaeon]
MSKKTGRNAPCPCGSGRKYKKCCWGRDKIDDRALPSDLLDYAADWILGQPKMKDEFEKVLKKHVKDDTITDVQMGTIMDAFIFDHKLSNGKTPFRYFLDNAGLSPNDYSTYKGFENNVFSIFEVLEVYRGQGIKLQDLIWNKEYFVREKKGTYQVKPGYILFCRVTLFRSYFVIITPALEAWPQDAGYLIKRKLKYTRSDLQKRGMNAFDTLSVMEKSKDEPKNLDEIKKALKKKLNSLGIEIDFRGLNRRINESDDPMEAFPEIYGFNFPSNDDYKETIDLLLLLWNKYPRREFKGEPPEEVGSMGPKERSLLSDLLDETMGNIDPDDYSSKDEAEEAIDKFRGKWLKTPQKELDGRTPMDVILEERRELGNPKKDFTFHIKLVALEDYDENKAERFYMEGIQAYKQGVLVKAAELFEEVTDMYPENYKAWGNLGNCFAFLGDKKKAIKCYEKALSLEPGYEFSKKNLELIKGRTKDQLATMGVLGALHALMHDFDKKKKVEEIDVWKEIDREIKNAGKHK